MNFQPRYVTIEQACAICSVKKSTIFHWIAQKKVTRYKTPGGSNRFDVRELIRPSGPNPKIAGRPQNLKKMRKRKQVGDI